MDEWEQEGLNLRKKLRERLDQTREVEDQEIYRQIDDLILEETRNRYVSLRRKEALRTELFNSIRKLDILQELIDDDSVTEIMVNGTEGIFLERNGRLLCWEKKITSKEKLEDMVQQIAGRCNRIVNESVPVADARLSDGSRVSLVLPPVALNGPVITIRRFPKNPIHMDRLVELGAVTTEAAAFLRALVRSGYNIFISGGTGSGKTTFLNALSDFIPKEERIITIEDNAELQIQGRQRLVQKQHLRLVDQRPGNGHTLLLSAGQQSGVFILITLQADKLQHFHDLLIDDILTHLLDLQSEGDIFVYAQMGKQGVFLKYGIQLPLVGGFLADLLAVEDDASLVRVQETTQNPEQSRLSTAAGA